MLHSEVVFSEEGLENGYEQSKRERGPEGAPELKHKPQEGVRLTAERLSEQGMYPKACLNCNYSSISTNICNQNNQNKSLTMECFTKS